MLRCEDSLGVGLTSPNPCPVDVPVPCQVANRPREKKKVLLPDSLSSVMQVT